MRSDTLHTTQADTHQTNSLQADALQCRNVSFTKKVVDEQVEAGLERIEVEGQYLDRLAGHGIVPRIGNPEISDQHAEEPCLYLLKAACSLADILHERGTMTESEVRSVAVESAEALARVHRQGLVHGDIKPANILLSNTGQLWLADFDSAQLADGKPLTRASVERVSQYLRVPRYLRATPEMDVLALIVTVVELATNTLIDPTVSWRADDLHKLGCPLQLSSDIASVLNSSSKATAEAIATIFAQHNTSCSLPKPVTSTQLHDSTPTVDFLPIN